MVIQTVAADLFLLRIVPSCKFCNLGTSITKPLHILLTHQNDALAEIANNVLDFSAFVTDSTKWSF